jgi:type IV pilus assembly protein PilN
VIRVNLIVDAERARERSKTPVLTGRKLNLACAGLLLAAGTATGWWYWSLREESTALDQSIADAQQETLRLRSVLEQVKQFDTRKTQLQQRVSLIEELRKGQSGPVHLLDELSRNLPEMLWLTELKQQGTELTIEGRASSLTSVSDFVGNLERSAYFKRPVEIVSTQVEPLAQGEVVKFSVKAKFEPPAV